MPNVRCLAALTRAAAPELGVFLASRAENLGVTARQLADLRSAGVVERIYPRGLPLHRGDAVARATTAGGAGLGRARRVRGSPLRRGAVRTVGGASAAARDRRPRVTSGTPSRDRRASRPAPAGADASNRSRDPDHRARGHTASVGAPRRSRRTRGRVRRRPSPTAHIGSCLAPLCRTLRRPRPARHDPASGPAGRARPPMAVTIEARGADAAAPRRQRTHRLRPRASHSSTALERSDTTSRSSASG